MILCCYVKTEVREGEKREGLIDEEITARE